MEKKLLVVGIDPGVTTAYAAIDLDENLVRADSSKQLELNRLISEVVDLGKPVLVGTDKAKIPSLVQEFAVKVGADVACPKEDLKVLEKRAMTSSFQVKDVHQADALAAALFARRSVRQLLDKIDMFAARNEKQHISNAVKELVLTKRISIKSAVSIIERKDEETQIIEKVIAEKNPKEPDFLRLYEKLKRYEKELSIAKSYNENLKNRVKNLEKNKIAQEPKKDADKIADFRESRIRSLESRLKAKEDEAEHFKLIIRKLNGIISDIDGFCILKKLDNLSSSELESRGRFLNIKKNDMLLVDNPNIASDNAVGQLKDKVTVIIHKKPVSKKTEERLPFVFVSAGNLAIEEDRYFGFVEKKQFESEKNKVDWVKKIVEDYRKEKQLVSR